MSAIGITPAGFSVPTLQAILAAYQAAVLSNVSPTLDLSETSPEGQWLGILADADASLYELCQAVVDAFDPLNAEGAMLDNIGDIRGIPREGPSFTQVPATLTIDAAHAPYAAGTLVANVQGFPSQTFSNLGAVTAAMISGGVANAITFQATSAGPTPTVNPGTLTAITTAVTGWTAITNPTAQTINGTAEESDDAYLVRQEQEIGIQGNSNPPAIVAQLYQLLAQVYGAAGQSGPYSVSYYENTSLQTITVGGTLVLPGKTFSVVIYDPNGLLTSAQIATVVWQNKPAGITPVGATTATVNDKYLGLQTVAWNTPTPKPLWISATVGLYPGQSWSNVEPAILSAIAAAAVAPTPASGLPPNGQLRPGVAVIGSQLTSVISSVAGVADAQAPSVAGGPITALTFGFSGTPTNTAPLAVDPLSVATIDTTKIVMTQGVFP